MPFSIFTHPLGASCTLTLLGLSKYIPHINALRTLTKQAFNPNNNNVNITGKVLSCYIPQYVKSVTAFLNMALKFSSTSHSKNQIDVDVITIGIFIHIVKALKGIQNIYCS